MNKVSVVDLEEWHVEYMHGIGAIVDENYGPDMAKHLCTAGPSVALFVGGQLILLGGVIVQHAGVARAWLIIPEYTRKKYPKIIFIEVRKFIEEQLNSYHRLEMTIEEGFDEAINFAQHLGFKYEGHMLYYSPSGKTHLLYARYLWHKQQES